jgi:hypothetical protein
MKPIRSLEEPDPVQEYMLRQERIRLVVITVIVVLLAAVIYWELFR